MTDRTPKSSTGLASLAERQMRKWSLGLEVRERLEHEKALRELPHEIHPFITISRECGSGGAVLARRVGEILGWEVLDSELLEYMAQRYRINRGALEFIDEATSNWLLELFGKWMNHKLVTPSEYMWHLGQIVLLSARSGSCVFVGRGVQFLLPSHRGLTVRVVAPLEMRIEEIMKRKGCDREQAEQFIAETDSTRRDFVEKEFHRDVEDLHQYDLGLNREHIDVDTAADLIVREARRRFQAALG